MKRLSRRSLLTAPALLGAPASQAQGVLPTRGIRILIGFPVNGGTDEMARVVATSLQRRLSRPVTIESRPGAAGAAAGEWLKKAPADGSVLAFIPTATVIGKLTTASFPFDPQTDIKPLTLAGTYPTAFAVSPRLGLSTLAAYGDWLKTCRPEEARFGTTSLQSFTQYFGMLLGKALGRQLDPVSFRGASPLVADLEQGRVPAGTGGLTSFLQHHRGARVKILVTSGSARSPLARDIPTVGELGYPQLEVENWYAFFGPAGLSPEVSAAARVDCRNLHGRRAEGPHRG